METTEKPISPYLHWIIADDYYDGAVSGIGRRRSDNEFIWFRVVAWDDEQWQRVFAVTTIDPAIAGKLIDSLEKVEARRRPFWLPGPASDTPENNMLWGQVLHDALQGEKWWLVETHDLIDSSLGKFIPISKDYISDVIEKIRSNSIADVFGASLIDEFLIHLHQRP